MNVRRGLMLIAATIAMFISSCASVSQSASSGVGDCTVERLDEAALKRNYGANRSRNPFIPFEGMLFRKRDEFIAVRIGVKFGEASLRFIETRPIEPDGFLPAYLDKAALSAYWEANTPDVDIERFRSDYERRSALIRSLCLANDETVRLRPDKERILVFKDPYPLPESWAFKLALLIDGERREYEIRHPNGDSY